MEVSHHYLLVVVAVVVPLWRSCAVAQGNALISPPYYGFRVGDNFKATLTMSLSCVAAVILLFILFQLHVCYFSGHYRNPAAAGCNHEAIEKCPILVYSTAKELCVGNHAVECAVCLGEFEDCDTVKMLPKCQHVFHRHCIDAWLPSRMNCPICRQRVTSDTVVDIDVPIPGTESAVSEVAVEQPGSSAVTGQGDDARGSRWNSAVGPGEDFGVMERFSLRLSEDVRREIVANRGRIHLPGAWSSKIGERCSLPSMSMTPPPSDGGGDVRSFMESI